jgi:hypothetical protein
MKDFYDLWQLARQFDFNGSVLATSIATTFRNRKTVIDTNPIALTSSFAETETTRRQWAAFLRKGLSGTAPQAFEEITDTVRAFLFPIADALAAGRSFDDYWTARGPWRPTQ